MPEPDPLRGPPNRRRDRPSDGLLLIGSSWTRAQVAHHLGIAPGAVAVHPHLLRIDGPLCFDAAYPCLQFDEDGVRLDVAVVSLLAGRRVPHDEVCDWLVRANPGLGGTPPLLWLDIIGSVQPVLQVLPESAGPLPGTLRTDDGTPDQVASWVRRQEESGGRRPLDWEAIRARGGGVDASPDVRDLIESLQRRHD